MIVKFANLGRGVSSSKFTEQARRVRNKHRGGVVCLAEIDEADAPNEHKIVARLWRRATRVGWSTHVPILVPRSMRLRGWRVTDTRVVPAAVGLPRQSPARQLVVAQLSHRVRRKLPPLVIINAHWPRNADVLASRREAVMRVARRVVAQHYKRGRTVLFTCDSNGYDMRKLHPRARRIGGAGIDWIGVVEPPRGARINVKSRGSIDLTIDGHNAHWVRFRVSKR